MVERGAQHRIVLMVAFAMLASVVHAGPLDRSLMRAIAKKAHHRPAVTAPAGRHSSGAVALKDNMRDSKTPATPLRHAELRHRYTTAQQAAREARVGLHPGSHTTATIQRGRPLSAESAQRRYGLPARPSVRTTWRLPTGTLVKHNKALAGAPGVGEYRVVPPIPPKNRVQTVRLQNRKPERN